MYGCETWSLTLWEEQRLRVLENKVHRKIFGPKRDKITGEWRKLHNAKLQVLYSSPNITRNLKSRWLRWAEHVACTEESTNAYRVLEGRPDGKERDLGRMSYRKENNVCVCVCSNANPLHYYVLQVPLKWRIDGVRCGLSSNHAPLGDHFTFGTSICIVYSRKLRWDDNNKREGEIRCRLIVCLLFSKSSKEAARLNVPGPTEPEADMLPSEPTRRARSH